MIWKNSGKAFLAASVIFALFLFGCASPQPPAQQQICGNYICEGNEASACPQDCKAPEQAQAIEPVQEGYSVGGNEQIAGNCEDSDGGKNYFEAGYVVGKCADCEPAGTTGGNMDACSADGALLEFYCSDRGWTRETAQCQKGCLDGECLR